MALETRVKELIKMIFDFNGMLTFKHFQFPKSKIYCVYIRKNTEKIVQGWIAELTGID